MKKLIYLFVLVILLSGCTTTMKPGMIWMYTKPETRYEKDPEANFSKYKSFSVFPQAELKKENKINPIEEKQILFMLRNRLELLGYNYVVDVKDADLIIGIDYSNEYKTQYTPPSSYTIPWYVPGQTQTTFVNNYNTFSGNLGSRSFQASGSGYGTATTKTPSYYVPVTYTKPGGYVGWYYPCFVVSVFDNNSKKLVFSGSVVGATSNPDVRLSAQVLFYDLFGRKESNFPENKNSELLKKAEQKGAAWGIQAFPYTFDGNNFFPTVFGVYVGSSAYEQGIKIYDTITQMDNKSTLNLSFSKFCELGLKGKGESMVLSIKRNNEVFDVTIVAEELQKAKREWREMIILDKKGNTKKIRVAKSQ